MIWPCATCLTASPATLPLPVPAPASGLLRFLKHSKDAPASCSLYLLLLLPGMLFPEMATWLHPSFPLGLCSSISKTCYLTMLYVMANSIPTLSPPALPTHLPPDIIFWFLVYFPSLDDKLQFLFIALYLQFLLQVLACSKY